MRMFFSYHVSNILVNTLVRTTWYVLNSDHDLVGSKISTVEDAVLTATACVVLAGPKERRPKRVYVWSYSKVREKYRASDLLYQMINQIWQGSTI